jgi:hypothetical protein
MKELGITDVPVNVVIASEVEAKKAALISNMVRLKMHSEDISKVLLEIYDATGYSNIDTIIINLNRLVASQQDRRVPGAF